MRHSCEDQKGFRNGTQRAKEGAHAAAGRDLTLRCDSKTRDSASNGRSERDRRRRKLLLLLLLQTCRRLDRSRSHHPVALHSRSERVVQAQRVFLYKRRGHGVRLKLWSCRQCLQKPNIARYSSDAHLRQRALEHSHGIWPPCRMHNDLRNQGVEGGVRAIADITSAVDPHLQRSARGEPCRAAHELQGKRVIPPGPRANQTWRCSRRTQRRTY
jgi:hypothetical protein